MAGTGTRKGSKKVGSRDGRPKKQSTSRGKALNRSLTAAKATKQDEFYTQLSDIEKELKHYQKHFKNKIVLCNCDDPRVSNFFKYFVNNFEKLGLKKVISTCYQNDQPDLFSQNKSANGIYFEYSGEQKNSRLPDPAKIKPRKLKGDGDFRSEECTNLLKQADIVVTNPPFSLFSEYVMQLAANRKKFLIIGNHNAITYKEIFKLIKENKVWLGYTHPVAFMVPGHYEMRTVRSWRDKDGNNWRSLGNACWFTNLDIEKRHEELITYESYTPKKYPRYDNYDAIEVSHYKKIPLNYDGVMGVPITFLEHHNPDQFDVIGTTESNDPDNDCRTRVYTSGQCRAAYLQRFGKPGTYDLNASGVVKGVKVFKRVLIRRKAE